jgi:hypothetical protein
MKENKELHARVQKLEKERSDANTCTLIADKSTGVTVADAET